MMEKKHRVLGLSFWCMLASLILQQLGTSCCRVLVDGFTLVVSVYKRVSSLFKECHAFCRAVKPKRSAARAQIDVSAGIEPSTCSLASFLF